MPWPPISSLVASAMAPVQRTMDDFINAATRAQIDGLDYIVARFIDRMNSSLDGQFKHLGETLETAVATAQDFEMDEDPDSPLQKEIARIKAGQPSAAPEPVIELPGIGEENAGEEPAQ